MPKKNEEISNKLFYFGKDQYFYMIDKKIVFVIQFESAKFVWAVKISQLEEAIEFYNRFV